MKEIYKILIFLLIFLILYKKRKSTENFTDRELIDKIKTNVTESLLNDRICHYKKKKKFIVFINNKYESGVDSFEWYDGVILEKADDEITNAIKNELNKVGEYFDKNFEFVDDFVNQDLDLVITLATKDDKLKQKMDKKGETTGLLESSIGDYKNIGYIYKCLTKNENSIVEIDNDEKQNEEENNKIDLKNCKKIAEDENLDFKYLGGGSQRPHGCSKVYKDGKPTNIVYYEDPNKEKCGTGYHGRMNIIYLDSSALKDEESALSTLYHEIGHFFGLKHPFTSGQGLNCDSYKYTKDDTVMSYCNGKNGKPEFFREADIEAIKEIWDVSIDHKCVFYKI